MEPSIQKHFGVYAVLNHLLLLMAFALMSSCNVGFVPTGTAIIRHDHGATPQKPESQSQQLPSHARSAVHLGALQIGYDLSDQLGADLVGSGMSLAAAQVIVEAAKEQVFATVSTLIIPSEGQNSYSMLSSNERMHLTESEADSPEVRLPAVIAGPAVLKGALKGISIPTALLPTQESKITTMQLAMSSSLKNLQSRSADMQESEAEFLLAKMVNHGLEWIQHTQISLESAPRGVEVITAAATEGIAWFAIKDENTVSVAGRILQTALESSHGLIAAVPEEQKDFFVESLVANAAKGSLSALKSRVENTELALGFSTTAGKVAASGLQSIAQLQQKTGLIDPQLAQNSLKALAAESAKAASALLKAGGQPAREVSAVSKELIQSLSQSQLSKTMIGQSMGSITSGALQGVFAVRSVGEAASLGVVKELMGAAVVGLNSTNLNPQEIAESMGRVIAVPLEDLGRLELTDTALLTPVVEDLFVAMVERMDEAGVNQSSMVKTALQSATQAAAPALKKANFDDKSIVNLSGRIAKKTIEAAKEIKLSKQTDNPDVFVELALEITKGTMVGVKNLANQGQVSQSFAVESAEKVLAQSVEALELLPANKGPSLEDGWEIVSDAMVLGVLGVIDDGSTTKTEIEALKQKYESVAHNNKPESQEAPAPRGIVNKAPKSKDAILVDKEQQVEQESTALTTEVGPHPVDTTPPSAVSGLEVDNLTSLLSRTPTFRWRASTDFDGSGLNYYEAKVGSTPEGEDIHPRVNIGRVLSHSLHFTQPGPLQVGMSYYISVRSVDNAGNASDWAVSDDIFIAPKFAGEVKKLQLPTIDESSVRGGEVVVSDHYAAIGSSKKLGAGLVLVYTAEAGGSTWNLASKLSAPDLAVNAGFGKKLALHGDLLFVSGEETSNSAESTTGVVYVYKTYDQGNNWEFLTALRSDEADSPEQFGAALASTGERLIIGAPNQKESVLQGGSVYIFRSEDHDYNWVQERKVSPPVEADAGLFGFSLAASTEQLMVGAPGGDCGVDQASVFVYQMPQNSDSFNLLQNLLPSTGEQSCQFGFDIALAGGVAIIGAPQEDQVGAAYAFKYQVAEGRWEEQQRLLSDDSQSGAMFGMTVALQDDYALIAAPKTDSLHFLDSGAVYVFSTNDGGIDWHPSRKLHPKADFAAGMFGSSIGVGDGFVLITSPFLNSPFGIWAPVYIFK